MRLRAESALERVRGGKHPTFVEVRRDELTAHREAIDATDGLRHGGHAGEVRRTSEYVAQIHLVRIGDRAEPEGGRWRCGREEQMDAAGEHVGEISRDQGADLLRL